MQDGVNMEGCKGCNGCDGCGRGHPTAQFPTLVSLTCAISTKLCKKTVHNLQPIRTASRTAHTIPINSANFGCRGLPNPGTKAPAGEDEGGNPGPEPPPGADQGGNPGLEPPAGDDQGGNPGIEPPAGEDKGGNPGTNPPAGEDEGNVPTLPAPAAATEAPTGSPDLEPTRTGRRFLSFLAMPTDGVVPLTFPREPQYPFHPLEWDQCTRHKQMGGCAWRCDATAITWRTNTPRLEIGEVFLPGPGVERLAVWCGEEDWMGPAEGLDAACGSPMLHRWYVLPPPGAEKQRGPQFSSIPTECMHGPYKRRLKNCSKGRSLI